MIRCYVTGPQRGDLLLHVARAIRDGVEMIQVRQKDVSASNLFELVCRVRDLAAASPVKVLVNDRLDVALAAGVDGVHLPGNGLPPELVRPYVRCMGVSTHSAAEAVAAEKGGADFIVFGSVFDTPGKTAVGLDALRQVVAAVRIPVLAIGGMREDRIAAIRETGAAGYAAIRLFQRD